MPGEELLVGLVCASARGPVRYTAAMTFDLTAGVIVGSQRGWTSNNS